MLFVSFLLFLLFVLFSLIVLVPLVLLVLYCVLCGLFVDQSPKCINPRRVFHRKDVTTDLQIEKY